MAKVIAINEWREMILARLDIVTALERYAGVTITTQRKKFNIRCPFHDDRNPSFGVDTTRNRWTCFSGCGRGNVIDLVMKLKDMTYTQAVLFLVDELGLRSKKVYKTALKEVKKRIQLRELEKLYRQSFLQVYDTGVEIVHAMRSMLRGMKSVEDLDRIGHLYHEIVKIEHLLDVMELSRDDNEQFDAFFDLKQKSPFWLDQLSSGLGVTEGTEDTAKEVL